MNRVFRRFLNSKIPSASRPQRRVKDADVDLEIPPETLQHLQRLSLVEFGGEEAVARLREAVRFVKPLKGLEAEAENVSPMFTVLEDETLRLREDEPEEDVDPGERRQQILSNAVKIAEEDFFVAPKGNVPVDFDKS